MIPTPEMALETVRPSASAAATWEDIPATSARALARAKDPITNLWGRFLLADDDLLEWAWREGTCEGIFTESGGGSSHLLQSRLLHPNRKPVFLS